jgi:N-acetyl-gamma-glutamyl-phosphate reductase
MLNVVVIGATGYAGAELVSILLGHPEVRLAMLTGSSRNAEGTRDLSDLHPRFRGGPPLPIENLNLDAIEAARPDAVLLATPHEASLELAVWLHDRGIRVLDLSAAFRLPDCSLYPTHYDFEHDRPDLLDAATYGLAELNATAIRESMFIAVPGCYPTSFLLPVLPLVQAGLVDLLEPAIIDATSGVSGAGRKVQGHTSFCEVSLQAYAALGHRHQPEMACHAGLDVLFTPHLGAFERGILSTIHLKLANHATPSDAREVLESTYSEEPGVVVLASGQWPSVSAVRGTNRCDIGLVGAPAHRRLMISSAIDNLVRGAAGQAVQCLNLSCGLPINTGLLHRNRYAERL